MVGRGGESVLMLGRGKVYLRLRRQVLAGVVLIVHEGLRGGHQHDTHWRKEKTGTEGERGERVQGVGERRLCIL